MNPTFKRSVITVAVLIPPVLLSGSAAAQSHCGPARPVVLRDLKTVACLYTYSGLDSQTITLIDAESGKIRKTIVTHLVKASEKTKAEMAIVRNEWRDDKREEEQQLAKSRDARDRKPAERRSHPKTSAPGGAVAAKPQDPKSQESDLRNWRSRYLAAAEASGYFGYVSCIAFSPDGKLLAARQVLQRPRHVSPLFTDKSRGRFDACETEIHVVIYDVESGEARVGCDPVRVAWVPAAIGTFIPPSPFASLLPADGFSFSQTLHGAFPPGGSALAFSSDGEIIASGDEAGGISGLGCDGGLRAFWPWRRAGLDAF